jgi:hypothetical protein
LLSHIFNLRPAHPALNFQYRSQDDVFEDKPKMRLFALILPLLMATVVGSPAPEADKKVKDEANEYGTCL